MSLQDRKKRKKTCLIRTQWRRLEIEKNTTTDSIVRQRKNEKAKKR